jgi:spermidine synthase
MRMDGVAFRGNVGRGLGIARAYRVVLAIYSATLFLSALLLFSIQPIFAKMVLPKLGGSPSVWAVSMCFFQGVLLAGYCYAHGLNQYVSRRRAPLVHLALLASALLALPFGLPAFASEPPVGDAYFWLIGVLALGVGLPFFTVSATAPLLQAWFARSGHPHAADPYFLYGASNLGSLVALLVYPVALEPVVGLAAQSRIWTAAFLLVGLLIAACGLLMLVALGVTGEPENSTGAHTRTSGSPHIAWSQRLTWMGLAFVPSGLLVAFTSYVTTDIASAPFLWVIPLALYLVTFILVFRDTPVIPHGLLLTAQPALVALALLGLSLPGNKGWAIAVLSGSVAFVVTTLVCHKELYDRRPESTSLTEFYLWMSLGGVLGGIFAAVVAPQVFNATYEFPLLLVFGMACRPGLKSSGGVRAEVRNSGPIVAALLGIVLVLAAGVWAERVPQSVADGGILLLIVCCGVLMLIATNRPLRQASYAAVMGLALFLLPTAFNEGLSERSFFGVHRVKLSHDGRTRLLMHGTTLHGAERIVDGAGNPLPVPVPATYYHPASPMARGVEAARLASGKLQGGLNVGIVGLGTGSLSCYARSGETWRFYEIDPVVVKLASDPNLFTFLARCRPSAKIVVGDARLTLAKEKPSAFDYLVIDAFSSDSVPVHLLTVEALALYLDKLAPDGILAVHVSNRHLDLASVTAAVADTVPGTFALFAADRPVERGFDSFDSHVVFITRSAKARALVRAWKDVRGFDKGPVPPWTDDYSDIPSAIWRKYVR